MMLIAIAVSAAFLAMLVLISLLFEIANERLTLPEHLSKPLLSIRDFVYPAGSENPPKRPPDSFILKGLLIGAVCNAIAIVAISILPGVVIGSHRAAEVEPFQVFGVLAVAIFGSVIYTFIYGGPVAVILFALGWLTRAHFLVSPLAAFVLIYIFQRIVLRHSFDIYGILIPAYIQSACYYFLLRRHESKVAREPNNSLQADGPDGPRA